MEHIPLPTKPYHELIRVPYLISSFPQLRYVHSMLDQGEAFSTRQGEMLSKATTDFLTFPKTHDVDLSELFEGNFSTKRFEEVLGFLQSWCFLGLLRHTMWLSGVNVTEEELIVQAPVDDSFTNRKYEQNITTRILPYILGKVEARSRPNRMSASHRQAVYEEFSLCVSAVMKIVRQLNMSRMGNPLRADSHQNSTEPNLRDTVMLSIYLIGDFLHYVLMLWLPSGASPVEPDWTYIQFFPFIRNRLLQAGWCPSEIDLLSDQPVGISTLAYLSFVDRTTLGKKHSACASLELFQCTYEKLEQYETKHTSTCRERRADEFLDIMEKHGSTIEQIVSSYGVPIVIIHEIEDNASNTSGSNSSESITKSIRVKVQTWRERHSSSGSSTTSEYVAFSHVWSDGLGNKKANALPVCQLRRLQDLANRVSDRDASNPMPFWLDTLCVPIEQPYRGRAIANLCEIYTNAHVVLVLDAVILEKTTQVTHPFEMLMAVRTSNWTRRLWTFQEGVLARDLRFQFADRSLSSVDIELALIADMRHATDTAEGHNHHVDLEEMTDLPESGTGNASDDGQRLLRASCMYYPPISYLHEIQNLDQRQLGKFSNASGSMLEAISAPLCWRSTARPTDEPICLSNILRMEKEVRKKIATAPDSQRLSLLLAEFGNLPANILFVNRQRLEETGSRWMPQSFLGGGRQATMYHPTTMPHLNGKADILSSESRITGMKIARPGFLIEGVVNYSDMFFASLDETFEPFDIEQQVTSEEHSGIDRQGWDEDWSEYAEENDGTIEHENTFDEADKSDIHNREDDNAEAVAGIVIMADPASSFNVEYLSTRRLAIVLKQSLGTIEETKGVLLSAANTDPLEGSKTPLKFDFEQLVQIFLASDPPIGRERGEISAQYLSHGQEWIIQ